MVAKLEIVPIEELVSHVGKKVSSDHHHGSADLWC